MVVGTLAVEVAAVVVDAAVVQGAKAHEAVLQGVVPLLVHVVVPDDVLLTGESLSNTHTHTHAHHKQQVDIHVCMCVSVSVVG